MPVPEGAPLKRIRVDVPPGLAADPQTLPTCPRKQFEEDAKTCPPNTEAGFVELEAVVKVLGLPVLAPPLNGTVYNLPQEPNRPLLFGIAVDAAEPIVSGVELLLVGHVSEAPEPGIEAPSGDYHEYFEIDNIPTEVEVLGGRQIAPADPRIEAVLQRPGRQRQLPHAAQRLRRAGALHLLPGSRNLRRGNPAQTDGAAGRDRPLRGRPLRTLTAVVPRNPGYDQPDGATTEVIVPQNEKATEINTADIQEAKATFPEGLTLNPSTANGLKACSPAQVHFESKAKAECPADRGSAASRSKPTCPPNR